MLLAEAASYLARLLGGQIELLVGSVESGDYTAVTRERQRAETRPRSAPNGRGIDGEPIAMKSKAELEPIISQIASDASPVGMDAVYVHALILDKLTDIQTRLTQTERRLSALETATDDLQQRVERG